MEGTEWLEEVTEDTTIEKLKEKCLKHYVHGSLEDPKTLTHHKLVHAATERILMETKTVSDENLKDKGNCMDVTKLSQCFHFHHKHLVIVICLFGSLLAFAEAAATVPGVHTHDKQQNTDTLIDKDSHTK